MSNAAFSTCFISFYLIQSCLVSSHLILCGLILSLLVSSHLMIFFQVQEVLATLWDTLVELDDLTASTNSIMMLLARILSCPSVAQQGTGGKDSSLTELVPRLWPFFRHNIKSVRLAALETLKTLLIGNRKHKVCKILTESHCLNRNLLVLVLHEKKLFRYCCLHVCRGFEF